MDLRKKAKRTICKLCRKKKNKLSNNGLCVECSTKLIQDEISQLRVKRGPSYEKWKKNLAASLAR